MDREKILTQDLLDWLKSTHTDEESRGLLLAPVVKGEPENPQSAAEQERVEKITALNDAWQGASVFADSETEQESEATQPFYADFLALQALTPTHDNTPSSESEAPSDYADFLALQSMPSTHEDVPEPEAPSDHAELPALQELSDADDDSPAHETPPADETPSLNELDDTPDPEAPQPSTDSWQDSSDHEQHSSILNQAWHEAADLTINLNEPPQEMWTNIDDDDEPKDYIETSSLQGDAYIPIPKHGANFTQRLQATLRGRKERAARLAAEEAQREPTHPYLQKAMIFCGILMMTLAFACLGLWFIQRETPENLNARAQSLYEQGSFDEAAQLYQRGHRRYPHILTFLTGLARSSEKAGRTQTAIAAWNKYAVSLPKGDAERLSSVQTELDRLIPGGDTHTQPQPEPPAKTPEIVKTEPLPEKPKLPEVRPLTFDEALDEANHAFNIGMFSRAIRNFHKAHAIREDDIRPYVGLAGAYRAKGMFFDAKIILDEARRKFGRDPTLEVERKYLRGEQ